MTTPTLSRVAVVGCGQWGQNLVRVFAEQRTLDVLSDMVPSRAEKMKEQLSRQGYDGLTVCSWEEILEDASINAVALATPADQHADMAVSALNAGKNVFVEKPFALSIEDGEHIKNAATKAQKVVMVGHSFRYHPAFTKLEAMVREGKLGQIKHIHSRRLGPGRIRHDENAFWSLAPHDISMILALAAAIPVDISATGFHHLRSHIADVVSADLTFSNGCQAHIHVSWLYPKKERMLVVVGDEATAIFDDCQPWESKLRLYDNRINWTSGNPEMITGTATTVHLDIQEPLTAECQHFLKCVQTGQQPLTDAHEALGVLHVLQRVQHILSQTNSEYLPVAKIQSSQNDATLSSGSIIERKRIMCDAHAGQDSGSITAAHTIAEQNTAFGHCAGHASTECLIPLVDLHIQKSKIRRHLDQRIARVFDHANFILGPEVYELETQLARFCGATHVVTCGSGTGALTLSLLALEFRPGDAVLVPDLSFIATVEPIVLLGGVPIFVDVDPQHLTINPSLLEAGIATAREAGHQVVGVIAVDLYGQPADYPAIHEVATKHGLWVIGDAAQSFGASSDGHLVGSLTRLTTTSFFPSKPLGCYGDGGAIFTNDDGLASQLRSLRQHGLDKSKSKGMHIGLNSRLDTLQAAVLLCKLELHDTEILQRNCVAERYHQLLDGLLGLPSTRNGIKSAWAAYTVRTKERDVVKQHLLDNGIATAVYYAVPLHKHPAFQRFPVTNESCPITELACEEVLSLPMGPYLDFETQVHITNVLRTALLKIESNAVTL